MSTQARTRTSGISPHQAKATPKVGQQAAAKQSARPSKRKPVVTQVEKQGREEALRDMELAYYHQELWEAKALFWVYLGLMTLVVIWLLVVVLASGLDLSRLDWAKMAVGGLLVPLYALKKKQDQRKAETHEKLRACLERLRVASEARTITDPKLRDVVTAVTALSAIGDAPAPSDIARILSATSKKQSTQLPTSSPDAPVGPSSAQED